MKKSNNKKKLFIISPTRDDHRAELTSWCLYTQSFLCVCVYVCVCVCVCVKKRIRDTINTHKIHSSLPLPQEEGKF